MFSSTDTLSTILFHLVIILWPLTPTVCQNGFELKVLTEAKDCPILQSWYPRVQNIHMIKSGDVSKFWTLYKGLSIDYIWFLYEILTLRSTCFWQECEPVVKWKYISKHFDERNCTNKMKGSFSIALWYGIHFHQLP